MWRYVEVKVETFLKEGSVKYVVLFDGYGDVEEVNLVASWAE